MVDWTIIRILSWTESYFKEHFIDSPRLTAELLLAHSLDMGRLDLYLQHDRPLEKNELSDFKTLIKRRIQNEPVAYIIGEKGFYDSEFKVAKGVLIPRPDTETLVEQALGVLKQPKSCGSCKHVLELGVGSGAIIVSLAKVYPDHVYVANDISRDALDVAKTNAQTILQTCVIQTHVNFFSGTWLDAIKQNPVFDLIVSNPPYIPTKDIKTLAPEIYRFEPVLALDGGHDGLDCFRQILETAHKCLVSGGTLLLEMGFDQKEGLIRIFEQFSEYESIEFIKDLAGHDRVVKIKK